MLIAYDSMTGNVQRFVSKLPFANTIKITDDLVINEPYVLVTYTIGFGNIPDSTANFLKRNAKHLKGVAASGNRNWGEFFGKSGKLISSLYSVPLIHTFELSGTDNDLTIFNEGVSQLASNIYHTIA
jgi:protein involved in ribonucleotide reduction